MHTCMIFLMWMDVYAIPHVKFLMWMDAYEIPHVDGCI